LSEANKIEIPKAKKGKKIWRAIFHAMSGTLLVGWIITFDIDRPIYIASVTGIFTLSLAFDLLRLRNEGINRFFLETFRRLATPRESKSIASSTWLAFGVLITLTFFPETAALSAILVHSWADPAAGYVGQKWGKRPFLGGSIEGTVTFIFVAFLTLNIGYSLQVSFCSGCLCALVERLAWPIDDNLLVPPICAGILTALTLLL